MDIFFVSGHCGREEDAAHSAICMDQFRTTISRLQLQQLQTKLEDPKLSFYCVLLS
jgi:hypothetical protein